MKALFARNFFRASKTQGSLIPSSRYLITRLLDKIDWSRTRVIVEYGPGVGTMTAEFLRRMSADSTLVVIETDNMFVQCLQESLLDSRLRIVHGSAADVQIILTRLGCGPADCIVSGIPFSSMSDVLGEQIICSTHSVLKPSGTFLVYQFSGKLRTQLRRVFHHIECEFEWRNFPPAWIFSARRDSP